MDNSLRSMVFFAAIVECGSITAAAESLDVSKSIVSLHLKQLETSTGTRLLVRTTRRQCLTPAGEEFYLSCKAIRDQAEAALIGLQAKNSIAHGRLTITAPYALIESIVAPTLRLLSETWPKVHSILIVEDQRLDLVALNVDAAIRVGPLPDSTLHARQIGQFRDVLCASPVFLARERVPPSLETIAKCAYVSNIWQGDKASHCLTSKSGEPTQVLELHPTATANSTAGLLCMALDGFGIASLPEPLIFEPLATGRLEKILPEYEQPRIPVHFVHPFGRHVPTAVRSCLEIVSQVARTVLSA